jgi:uncharacterized protein DUF6162
VISRPPMLSWARRSGERTVDIVPPSRNDEAAWVLMAAGFVLLGMIYTYAFQREAAQHGARGATGGLLPHQVLFRDLPSAEQRMFRAMQEGAGEALRLRAERGAWPSTDALATAGVPPFAPDVLDKSGYRWSGRSEGLLTDYVGVPGRAQGAPAFLLFIQEPDPVTGERPPPPSVIDEEHQLLPGGVLLHVTYWKRSVGSLPPGMVVDPALEGWQQIRLRTPFEEMNLR